jgi:uncharacterized protein YndB with AHSA1/START domain
MTHATATSIQHSIAVEAPIERAFEVFTRDFGAFKPAEHNLLSVPIAETIFEPFAGGYLYDRGTDGSECRWARVVAYEPPERVLLTWNIGPTWQVETDPAKVSEWEVRFTAEAANRTLVELEHRHLDRHGEGWEGVREGVGSGWPTYLERYAAVVQRNAASE